MVDVSATTSTAATTDSSASLSALSEDYTRFLTLLTAQIENQDPLAPMDSTQFVSQLAQLSQVEQAVKTNSNLETLSAQLGALTSVSGAGMIGHDVTVSSGQILLEEGASDGYYMLSDEAAEVSATITDPLTDTVVREMTGLPTNSGELIALDWDGTDDLGEAVLDGTYTVAVTALDSDGNAMTAYTYRKTSVKEVLYAEGEIYYGLEGDQNVSADSILAVR